VLKEDGTIAILEFTEPNPGWFGDLFGVSGPYCRDWWTISDDLGYVFTEISGTVLSAELRESMLRQL
jgi:hypothetical protein